MKDENIVKKWILKMISNKLNNNKKIINKSDKLKKW